MFSALVDRVNPFAGLELGDVFAEQRRPLAGGEVRATVEPAAAAGAVPRRNSETLSLRNRDVERGAAESPEVEEERPVRPAAAAAATNCLSRTWRAKRECLVLYLFIIIAIFFLLDRFLPKDQSLSESRIGQFIGDLYDKASAKGKTEAAVKKASTSASAAAASTTVPSGESDKMKQREKRGLIVRLRDKLDLTGRHEWDSEARAKVIDDYLETLAKIQTGYDIDSDDDDDELYSEYYGEDYLSDTFALRP